MHEQEAPVQQELPLDKNTKEWISMQIYFLYMLEVHLQTSQSIKEKWLIVKVLSVESNLYYSADFLIKRSLQRKAPI